jgi:hypothetical protein
MLGVSATLGCYPDTILHFLPGVREVASEKGINDVSPSIEDLVEYLRAV